MDLVLDASAEAALRAHARRSAPREACGLLAGLERQIRRYVPMRNGSATADAFRIDPVEFARAESSLRTSGLDVLGLFHSHPGGTAQPSTADRDAAWAEHVWVILGTDGLRAWAPVEGGWHRVPLSRRSRPAPPRR